MCVRNLLTLSRLARRNTTALPAASDSSTYWQMNPIWGKRWFCNQPKGILGDDILWLSLQRKIKLLVDGDGFGGRQICDALDFLAGKFQGVILRVLVYGAPAMIKNKDMKKLLQQSNVTYVPVPRVEDLTAEPNDEAILSEMEACSKHSDGECIILLTQDKGFAPMIRQFISDHRPYLVLIPSKSVPVVNCYREHGIPVLTLPWQSNCPKVRAILHADGNGSVELGEALDESAKRHEVETTYQSWEELLRRHDCPALFSSTGAFPIQRTAKFWFANGLGSLPVFPNCLATLALDAAIRGEPRKWISNTKTLAFVLPVSSNSTMTKSGLTTYGSQRARSIFRGGGPFMLEDSPELPAQALRKLGYLDEKWNTDLTEALNCFWNAARNKLLLRLLGLMIGPGETTSEAEAKLRMALLSDKSCGNWQLGGTSTATVVQILKSRNILPRALEAPAMDGVE